MNKGTGSNNSSIKLLLELVKIDSVTGQEECLAIFIENLLKRKKINCLRDKKNNIIVKVDGVGEPLFLCAHLDTVEPGKGIKPIVSGDKITSDGSTILGADNKVGVAVLLDVILRIHEKKLSTRPLEIVLTTSEESGSYGALALDYKNLNAKEGYVLDFSAPVGHIVIASPFYDRFDIVVLGKGAHASKPEEGINALTILQNSLAKIPVGKVSKKTFINIGVVEGGSVRNAVPEKICIKGEVRSFSEEEQNNYISDIKKAFEQSSEQLGGEVEMEFVRENGGYEYSKNDPFIKKTADTMKKLGFSVDYVWHGGVSDGNVLTDQGIKVLNLGDGTKFAHTVREEASISEMGKLNSFILEIIKPEL